MCFTNDIKVRYSAPPSSARIKTVKKHCYLKIT